MEKLTVAITQGDTNGIGLEVALKALNAENITDLFTPVVFANHHLAKQTLKMIGAEALPMNFIQTTERVRHDRINIVNVGAGPLTPQYGAGTPASGAAAVESLIAACNYLEDGGADVLVTAPINKEAAQVDDFHFPGHTEFLQDRFGEEGDRAQMILFNDELRVALATTHLPVAKIAGSIHKKRILDSIRDLSRSIIQSFEVERPKIAVLSLNPHCGDNGLLGKEEQTEISPAIEEAFNEGILAFGPFAADGFFAAEHWRVFDGVLAMYHDQGLAPFKAIAGKTGVNYTSGLQVVRTSPDHGTAYDIAGRNEADGTSMRQAIYAAIDIWRCRERYEEMSENPLKICREPKGGRHNKGGDEEVVLLTEE